MDKLGPGATKWKIGDRVMALLPGRHNFINKVFTIIFIHRVFKSMSGLDLIMRGKGRSPNIVLISLERLMNLA